MDESIERFLIAQQQWYRTAFEEIKAGRKMSHWMWYIFPQIQGLGISSTAQIYAIKDMEEAKEYLADYTLRKNLVEISEVLLQNECDDATKIFGYPDDLKLRSCMTLFALADKECTVFQQVLDRFFAGEKDQKTIAILNKQKAEKNGRR